jgi:hypothetical protein
MTAAVGPLPHFCPTPVSQIRATWRCPTCGRLWFGVDFGSCTGWVLLDPAGQSDGLIDVHVLDSLARAAYLAYGEVTGGRNYQGLPMPDYDELPDTIQRAWRAAACAARTAGRAIF